MADKIIEMNRVSISGIITSDFQAICTENGKKYYTSDIEIRRLSGRTDIIPVTVPVRLFEVTRDYKEKYVCLCGQFRSKNCYDREKRRLKLYVYAKKLELRADGNKCVDDNYIFLDGYLCKEPICRATSLGRTVTDLIIAVNSPYGKANYIPCICWGKTAHFAAHLPVGSHVGIEGRTQSREYYKKLSSMKSEKHIAYEVSISKLKIKT